MLFNTPLIVLNIYVFFPIHKVPMKEDANNNIRGQIIKRGLNYLFLVQ